MILRDASPDDALGLAEFAAAAYRAAFLPILGEAGLAMRTESFFARRFAAEWPHLRLAEAEEGVLGFCELRARNIDMLFVRPELTGRGVGRLLLADAEIRGAETLECFSDNTGARRFYERWGWRAESAYARVFCGRRHAFVGYRRIATD